MRAVDELFEAAVDGGTDMSALPQSPPEIRLVTSLMNAYMGTFAALRLFSCFHRRLLLLHVPPLLLAVGLAPTTCFVL